MDRLWRAVVGVDFPTQHRPLQGPARLAPLFSVETVRQHGVGQQHRARLVVAQSRLPVVLAFVIDIKQAGKEIGVRLAQSAADAVRETDIIVAAVTAASSVEAARSVEPHLSGAPIYLDINSVSPGRKQATAKLLGDKARYIDVAVIAAIHPALHRTPMLLAGPHAEAATPLLRELDMQVTTAGDNVGAAAAIKMIRSVMIKGIEALTLECFIAAARAGVLD